MLHVMESFKSGPTYIKGVHVNTSPNGGGRMAETF